MRLEVEKKKRQRPPFPTRQTKRPKKPPSRERERETDRLKEVDSKRVRDRRKGRRGEERWSAKK